MADTAFSERRELAHRTSDGFDVTLFWSMPSDRITIIVVDTRADEVLEFEVDRTAALDAFNHPYAYAGARRNPGRAVSGLGADALAAGTDC